MKETDLKIRIKIIAGYLLIALFTSVTVWYIYGQVEDLVFSDDRALNTIYEKSALTSATISSLYAVEYSGNRLIQSFTPQNKQRYHDALETLYADMDSLEHKINDTVQLHLLTEIRSLLVRKHHNIETLAELCNKLSINNVFNNTMSSAIRRKQADTTKNIVIQTSHNRDTIVSPTARNRNFFQRVYDVFAPQKTHNKKNISVVRTHTTDTLRMVPTSENDLVATLNNIKQDVDSKHIQNNAIIRGRLQTLIATEQDLSNQISLLIAELNHEATDSFIAEYTLKRDALQRSERFLVLGAIIAVVLIVMFLTLIIRDINKSQRYKRELEEARLHAEQLMNDRHRMLLNISHDIKAPLCSITGYLDLLNNSSDPKAHEYSGSMKISAGYIMNLLVNLLDYARMESGKGSLHLTSFDLDDLVADVYKIFEPLAAAKNLIITLQRPDVPLGYIESDPIKLRQIMMNLLSNAIKFTDRGGVSVGYALSEQGELRIDVADSGCGIAPDKHEEVFGAFARTQSADAEGREGNGLGLSVVRGIVDLLQGELSLESELGKGSRFTVTIPVSCCSEPPGAVVHTSHPMQILVVDDDMLQLKMAAEMLQRLGHTPHTAQSMKQVPALLADHAIDLVLTDLQMGRFSGYELLQNIRKQGFLTPVVAVSASDRINLDELRKAGFCDFLKKPFSLAELRTIVAEFSTPLIDTQVLHEMMEGDEEAVEEIMMLFYNSNVENIHTLRADMADGNLENIKNLCHKMLPMCLQLNIVHAADILRTIDRSDVSQITDEQIRLLILIVERVQFQIKAQYRIV